MVFVNRLIILESIEIGRLENFEESLQKAVVVDSLLKAKIKKIKSMGLFWDLLQQSQISDQQVKAESLESRIAFLEVELQKTQKLLIKTLKVLEEQSGRDIDGDGRLG
jgi:polyribonucleotide nucleotidyltransferase